MKLHFSISEREHGGQGTVKFEWQPTGNYLATAGVDNRVLIFDRHGRQIEQIQCPGAVTSLCWDKDGDVLAVTNLGSNQLLLCNITTRKTHTIDSGIGVNQGLTFALWSPVSQLLAAGNIKGNLLLYNHTTQRKDPIIGKHTKQITCGAFSRRDLLALGSDDGQITVSAADGELVHNFDCNNNPEQIQFAAMKASSAPAAAASMQTDSTMSAVVGKRILMLINLNEPETPINLQFQARYGDIVAYKWFGDGYIMIGFDQGFIVSISTHVSEIGSEIFSIQEHKHYLSSVSVNNAFQKLVTSGDTCVKLRELGQLSQVYAIVELENEDLGLDRAQLNADGQLLAVSGRSGALYVYLTKLPVVGAAHCTRLAVLTSLTEITVHNDVQQEPPIVFSVEVEPSFLGVGPSHVAVGMNNRAAFYSLSRKNAVLVREYEYVGSVLQLQLNGTHAAAMLDTRVQLHRIEDGNSESELEGKIFPDGDKSSFRLLAMALTNDFLILASEAGHIQYFALDDWKWVNEFRHSTGVKEIYPEASGTRLCFVDTKRDMYVYSPIDDLLVAMPPQTLGATVKAVLWENWPNDKDIFVVHDSAVMYTFIYQRDNLAGPCVKLVGKTRLPYGHVPLMLYNGDMCCQTQSGRTGNVRLETHQFDPQIDRRTDEEIKTYLENCLLLKRWLNAWRLCEHKKDVNMWQRFGQAALECLDVELAMRVYRQLKDVGMVWALEELLDVEDTNLLAGHIALLLDRFDLAERLYLESSQPLEALELRRDLLHWERALQLAQRLAPDEVSVLAKEYAQQLEYTAEYADALAHYEQAVLPQTPENTAHNEACEAGIARMSLRQGDVQRGMQLAMASQQRANKKQCALILESIKQYNEAAQLYEQGQYYDRAAAVCIKAKNWMKVGDLLPKVHSPKIHAQYAKAMEADKKYKQAADAYRHAKDYDNLARLLLDHLNNPDEAVKIVRESKSVDGAKLVSKFFLKIGDHGSAIQFLVMSHCYEEAFRLAEEHNKVDVYAEVIGDQGTIEQYESIALHFEQKRQPFLCGKFYYLAEKYDKDPKYLFRLYLSTRMYKEAEKTAVIIANDEQEKGSYRLAHDVLVSMHRDLRTERIKVSTAISNNLMLLHSYLIVKPLSKRGEHMAAARMLIRVATSISKFPAHTVQILSSAVIQCTKVGLKKHAFKFAAQLMRPEYRKQINENYKQRIENIVRKQDQSGTEPAEPLTPCAYCDAPLPETELNCTVCQNTLPYCIVTGQHLLKEDMAKCAHCQFPAIGTYLKIVSGTDGVCPMCGETLGADDVLLVNTMAELDGAS